MKTFVFLLCLLISYKTIADGGEEPIRAINLYEPNLNLQYIGIKDTLEISEKNKQRKFYVTSTIAILDIPNNKTNYIFKDYKNLNITGFYFESKYLAEDKSIEFNNYFTESYQYSNNRNILERPLSNNLIIITEDLITKNTCFWICDKYGNNLKKEFEINTDWDWEIDVKNRMIRARRQVNLMLEIKTINY